MNILVEIRKYKLSYAKFVDFISNETIINNPSNYFNLNNHLGYGYIDEFMYKYGCSIIIGETTVSVIINNTNTIFATFEHKGLKFIYSVKQQGSFEDRYNNAILGFFKELNEQLTIL